MTLMAYRRLQLIGVPGSVLVEFQSSSSLEVCIWTEEKRRGRGGTKDGLLQGSCQDTLVRVVGPVVPEGDVVLPGPDRPHREAVVA